MKLMFISDIHGSLYYINEVLKNMELEKPDKLIILGDILYHGPRNPLTKEYNPKEVVEVLNSYKDQIIAVRGNCDSEVDQMVLDFDMFSDYKILKYNNRRLFITHGHLYDKTNMPELDAGDIFIHGHYHIHLTDQIEGVYYLNPGSISLPKEDTVNSYGIIEDDKFMIKNMNMEIVKEINFGD